MWGASQSTHGLDGCFEDPGVKTSPTGVGDPDDVGTFKNQTKTVCGEDRDWEVPRSSDQGVGISVNAGFASHDHSPGVHLINGRPFGSNLMLQAESSSVASPQVAITGNRECVVGGTIPGQNSESRSHRRRQMSGGDWPTE